MNTIGDVTRNNDEIESVDVEVTHKIKLVESGRYRHNVCCVEYITRDLWTSVAQIRLNDGLTLVDANKPSLSRLCKGARGHIVAGRSDEARPP